MVPAIAEAATVAGEAMYTRELGSPMRPLKFRVLEVMQTSCSASTPMWPPPQAPHVGGAMVAPASIRVTMAPLFMASRYTVIEAGTTIKIGRAHV